MSVHSQLKKFDKRKSPARISLNYENAIHYNMYSVYITHPESGNKYLFESYQDGRIQCKGWNEDKEKFEIPTLINASELNEDSFSGVLYYKAHQAEFSSLRDLVFWREWGYKSRAIWENYSHSRTKYLYRMKKYKIKNRTQILEALVELYLDSDKIEPVSLMLLIEKVYTRMWIYHPKPDGMRKEIRLFLNAYETSGEVSKIDDTNYIPTGKALLTLEKYLEDEKKHNDMKRIQIGMLVAAVGSFAAACFSAYAAFIPK